MKREPFTLSYTNQVRPKFVSCLGHWLSSETSASHRVTRSDLYQILVRCIKGAFCGWGNWAQGEAGKTTHLWLLRGFQFQWALFLSWLRAVTGATITSSCWWRQDEMHKQSAPFHYVRRCPRANVTLMLCKCTPKSNCSFQKALPTDVWLWSVRVSLSGFPVSCLSCHLKHSFLQNHNSLCVCGEGV
jgi:hypothetical protein